MTAAGHGIAEHAVHHAALDGEVDHRFLIAVVDAGEFGLLTLFLHHLHLLHQLGGNVLGGQLRVVQEESFAGDGDLGDGFAVGGDGAVFGHFNAGELLQKVHQHVVVADLKGRCVVFHRILLDDDRVTHCRNGGGIQHLRVRIHLDHAQVHIGLHFQALLMGLVAHDFGLEGILAHAYFLQHGLAFPVCEGEFGLTFFCGDGNGGKAYGLSVGGVLQLQRYLVGLRAERKGGKEACEGHEDSSDHTYFLTNQYFDTFPGAKFNAILKFCRDFLSETAPSRLFPWRGPADGLFRSGGTGRWPGRP